MQIRNWRKGEDEAHRGTAAKTARPQVINPSGPRDTGPLILRHRLRSTGCISLGSNLSHQLLVTATVDLKLQSPAMSLNSKELEEEAPEALL